MEPCHGATLGIRRPKTVNRFETLGFGTGFYATSNEEQAREFAQKTFARRGRSGSPAVNVCAVGPAALAGGGLSVTRFDGPGAPWLEFVVRNRRFGRGPDLAAGLVVGPVADGNAFRTIELYESGDVSGAEAMEGFEVDGLHGQRLFRNEKALSRAVLSESREAAP